VSRRAAKLIADWLVVVGAAGLLASLFLPWSHQYPRSLRALPGLPLALAAVPRDATAWQVYSVADVLLAALAAGLVAVVIAGFGRSRWPAAAAILIGLAFTFHALSVPPTNGLDIVLPTAATPRYASALAAAGIGETVAIAALVIALCGLLVSAYPRTTNVRHPRRQATRAS
jgi:hypothetical protein